jgi:hypothetical protein
VATGCEQPAVSGRTVKIIPIADTARLSEGRTPTGVHTPHRPPPGAGNFVAARKVTANIKLLPHPKTDRSDSSRCSSTGHSTAAAASIRRTANRGEGMILVVAS